MAYTGNSIVDYLKSVGQDSSYRARSKMAAQYGISGYRGTAQQNLSLLSKLRSGSSSNTAPTPAPTPAIAPPAYTPPTFQGGTNLQNIKNQLTNIENSKPGKFNFSFNDQMKSLIEQNLNRPKFSYDFNNDPLYQAARNKYIQQGQKAMMDTMGNAATLTGGYGSSYATTVGQQAYQDNLSQINDIIPDLYNAAYGKYQDEGNTLRNNLSMLADREAVELGIHRDTVNDWNNDRNYISGRYDSLFGQEYGMFQDAENNKRIDREWQNKLEQQAYERQAAERQLAASLTKSSSGYSGRSKSSGSKGLSASAINSIVKKCESYNGTNNKALGNYLDSLVDSGTISESQADSFYAKYKGSSVGGISGGLKGLSQFLAEMR